MDGSVYLSMPWHVDHTSSVTHSVTQTTHGPSEVCGSLSIREMRNGYTVGTCDIRLFAGAELDALINHAVVLRAKLAIAEAKAAERKRNRAEMEAEAAHIAALPPTLDEALAAVGDATYSDDPAQHSDSAPHG